MTVILIFTSDFFLNWFVPLPRETLRDGDLTFLVRVLFSQQDQSQAEHDGHEL